MYLAVYISVSVMHGHTNIKLNPSPLKGKQTRDRSMLPLNVSSVRHIYIRQGWTIGIT